MSWNNQQTPPQNPWGSPKQRPTASGGGEPPFSPLDGLLNSPFAMALGGVGLVLIWLASGFYRVEPDSLGVVTRFGAYERTDTSGLNYHLPFPIETARSLQVTRLYRMEIDGQQENLRENNGFYALRLSETTALADNENENLMLTGDENIVNLKFSVMWRIKDARSYLFQVQDPLNTLRGVAESTMREVVGKTKVEPILTEARQQIEEEVRTSLQNSLDKYMSGIEIVQVAIQEAQPPAKVIEAFRDVQAARADGERLRNEAEAYANKIIPEARGDADRIRQEAEGYKQRIIAEAEGQANRFLKIYQEYLQAKEITTRRIYLETMENILVGKNKVILEADKGVLPHIPLGGNGLSSSTAPRILAPSSSGN